MASAPDTLPVTPVTSAAALLGVRPPDPWQRALGEVFGTSVARAGERRERAAGALAAGATEQAPLVAPPMPLADFVRGAWHVVEPGAAFVPNWHVDAICLHLEAVTRHLAMARLEEARAAGALDPNGVLLDVDPWWLGPAIKDLIINIPPGHMKSLIVAVFWPAWVWTFRPEWRAIFASYDEDLVLRDSVRCRQVITSEWYREIFRPTWRLASDQNVKGYFRNTRMGERKSVTVGGGATGFRGDAVVVDDPLNVRHRFSEEKRRDALDWWTQAMSSRLNDKRSGSRVIIMQRLHEADLAGAMLKTGGYEHLCLPTEFEPKRASATGIGWRDPRTVEGELLFPGMFPLAVVEEIKTELGSDGFAAQHQQRPNAATGSVFKRHWWRFYDRYAPKYHEILLSVDCTFKDTEGTDFVVMQVWGRVLGDAFLLDQVRARLDFPNTLRALRAIVAKWPEVTAKLIEDKANGPAVIAMLRHEIPGIIPVEPEGGKVVRAHAISPFVESGNVYLPDVELARRIAAEWERVAVEPRGWLDRRYVRGRVTHNDALERDLVEWVHEYIEEHAAMTPGGATGDYDDQIDATSQGLVRLLGRRGTMRPPSEERPSEVVQAVRRRF